MGTSAPVDPITGLHPLIPGWLPVGDPIPTHPPNDGSLPAVDVMPPRAFTPARINIAGAVRLQSSGEARGPSGSGRTRRGTRSSPSPHRSMRKAIAHYVTARGGGAGVANRLELAVRVGDRLHRILEQVASKGVERALKEFGVHLDEASAGALADALMTLVLGNEAAELEGVVDESLARASCSQTFMALYKDGKSLAELTAVDVPDIVRSFVINAAMGLLIREVGSNIYDKPSTEKDVSEVLSIMRSVVGSSVKLHLPTGDAPKVRDIRETIRSAYRDAFNILGSEEEE